MSLIQPGSPEWYQALKDVDELAKNPASPVVFETVPCPTSKSPRMEIAHTLLPGGDSTARLIFHFKNIAVADVSDLLSMLKRIVLEANISTSACNASVSEIFRNQYDFVWLELPAVRAPLLRQQIVHKTLALFKE